MKLEAYLFFPGNTEEAVNFYQSVLGGELAITRRGDVDPTAPRREGPCINAALDTGSFTLRASDRTDATNEVQTRIELSIIGPDENDSAGSSTNWASEECEGADGEDVLG